MAIYRAESGRRIAFVAVGAAVAGLVLGAVLGRLTAPGLGAQLDDVRTQAAPIASSLEVIRPEYPKLLAAGGDPGGAESAMARIESTFAAVKPALDVIDPAGTTALGQSIAAMRAALDARVPEADLGAAADKVQADLDAVLGTGS